MSQGKTYKFYGSQFKANTGLGSAKTITGLSNADPAVLTSVAHGVTTHAAGLIEAVGGMTEINGRIVVVERVTTDTLRLVGVDSTNYGAYTSGGTLKLCTMTAHCEQTTYTYDSGTTPVTEDETNCGVITNVGAPRLGSLSLGYKSASNAFQDALEAAQESGDPMVFLIQKPNHPKAIYDIGFVTQVTDGGSSGGTWEATASVSLTQRRVKVAA